MLQYLAPPLLPMERVRWASNRLLPLVLVALGWHRFPIRTWHEPLPRHLPRTGDAALPAMRSSRCTAGVRGLTGRPATEPVHPGRMVIGGAAGGYIARGSRPLVAVPRLLQPSTL